MRTKGDDTHCDSFLLDQSFACPVLLHGCGLRGLKGTISGRNVLLKTPFRSQIVLTETFSFRRCRGLSKKAHFQQRPLYGTTSLNAASCYPRNLRQMRDVMKIKSSTLLLALLFAISAAAQTRSSFRRPDLVESHQSPRRRQTRRPRHRQPWRARRASLRHRTTQERGRGTRGRKRLLPARQVRLPPDRRKGLQPHPDPRRQTRTAHAR